MTKLQKDVIKQLYEYNSFEYTTAKCAEELQELALELTRLTTKPELDDNRVQAIIDEIGDVEIRLKALKLHYDKDAINQRIDLKIAKFVTLLDNKRYKNI